MKYLLDANTFIQAKNSYYGMSFCPAYWEWILRSNQLKLVGSIDMVYDELTAGNDELAAWATANKTIFLPVEDTNTQNAFKAVVGYIQAESKKMKAGAMEDFLSGADPWLIAKAMATSATVVTLETLDLQAKKKFRIPNVCKNFNVSYLNTFELLSGLRARFALA